MYVHTYVIKLLWLKTLILFYIYLPDSLGPQQVFFHLKYPL